MYNAVYPYQYKSASDETMFYSRSLSTNWWYANNVIWGSPKADSYNLDNPYQVSTTADYPSLVGKYTFGNSIQTYTTSYVDYIAVVNNTTMYYIELNNTGNHTLADFNHTYTYGDSYTDNGNGTYTINNPTTIHRSDWYTSYSNVGTGKYVCKNATNNTCSELWYTTSTGTTSMSYIKVADTYKYAKGFTWDGSKYVLDNNTSVSFWNYTDSTNQTSLNNAHYTCWNTTGECESISYIYYISGTTLYYINITNGKSVGDAVNEMLYNNDVSQINSTMKSGVDAWYKKYILPFDSKVEDTIFCNDRSIQSLGGWNSNGGEIDDKFEFNNLSLKRDLSCANVTDQFSVFNNKAKLTYKVGLMSSPEKVLQTNSSLLKVGSGFWLISPEHIESSSYTRHVLSNGNNNNSFNGSVYPTANGLRPTVSLIPGIQYSYGDGSKEKPYYIGDVYSITNNSSIFKIEDKSPPGWEVKLENDDYAVTSFKLNGALVEGDSFVMPEEDVIITDIQYIPAYYSITNTDGNIIVPSSGRYHRMITLETKEYTILSFKLDGTLIEGNCFLMPSHDVVITDVEKIHQVTIESEHNPYLNGLDWVSYYDNTFEGATSITVELTYQTQGASYNCSDLVYLYDTLGSTTPYNNKKYCGSTLKTETLTINSNYLKIVFRTDDSGNNFYGFKAVITPNY
jgi:hypothetical protein